MKTQEIIKHLEGSKDDAKTSVEERGSNIKDEQMNRDYEDSEYNAYDTGYYDGIDFAIKIIKQYK